MSRAARLVVSLFVLLPCLVIAEDKKPATEEGFISLFNGKDLEGWDVVGKAEGWQVKDGVIRSEGATGGDWLRSKKQYGDYVLKVEWKVSKDGNSGVFLRCAEKGAPWLTGYEVQISNQFRDEQHCTGSLYGYVAVTQRPDESPDKWHTFELRCVGNQITVLSDGLKCVDVDQSTVEAIKGKATRGYIGLQDSHSPKGHYIEYRNIRIKSLDTDK